VKRKKASSDYDTKQCKKSTIHRMAFKGTITLLAVKITGIKITSKTKKDPVYELTEFSYKSGRKRPRFTGKKTGG
jgi:hypothetical protein